MAKKPIIEIDIDDRQFKAFYELFAKYEERLAKMQMAWEEANGVMNAGMGALVEQTHNIAKQMKGAIDAQKQFAHATHAGTSGLKKMAGEAKKVADSIFGIGKFILKTGAWGGGLLGGALFGLDRMAKSAVESQKSARSLGITTGQQRAFMQDYGRYGVTLSTVNAIANEQNMPGGAAYLQMQTGIPASVTAHMNPAELAYFVALGARRLAMREKKKNKLDILAPMLAANYFNLSDIPPSEARLLMNTRRKNLAQAHSNFQRDSATLNLPRAVVNNLYVFSRELSNLGKTFMTTFMNNLAPVAKNLVPLVRLLGTEANTLLKSALSPANIKEIDAGIRSFSSYLSSGKMQNAIESFGESLNHLSHDMGALGAVLDSWNPFKSTTLKKVGKYVGGQVFDLTHPSTSVTHAFGVPARKGSVVSKAWNWFRDESKPWYYGIPRNNPGNLRSWGHHGELGGFAVFNTAQGGLNAMSHQLQLYESRGINTLAKIIPTYAPAKDHNNDPAYIAAVKKMTGFKVNQPLDLENPAILAKLMRAMIYHEQGRDPYTHSMTDKAASSHILFATRELAKRAVRPVKIAMTVHNKTGADVALSANAAGG